MVEVPETTSTVAPLVPESDNYDENDSASVSVTSSTVSLGSSIMKYREENGRTYHAYKEGKYALPNDEGENDRLDHMNHLFSLTIDGKLYLSPLDKEKTHRVLDVGTGTGIWAIDFADEHPASEVVGIDLSPIQPSFIPPNVRFEIDDLEEPWTFSSPFDFIYCRQMTGSFSDWPNFFKQAYDNLNPGGRIELFDIVHPIITDDNSWPENSALLKWTTLATEAMIKFGRPINSTLKYKEMLLEAGFEDVKQTEYKWPINRWPKDMKAKELGMWTHENVTTGLFGLSAFVFTNLVEPKWTVEELEVFLVDVRNEFKDTKIHGYFPVYVVYGKKPEVAEAT
ncbi:hypothetical protein BP5796_12468 [Coleophoma crateriformis]|uniref:S-adenosyl-L-methionine-dependent methyltransferase n=1 Tax=Coleophoma crateriformis TaxID=565419 RepID=A0A3D8Q7K1_9HELO|nr:hypothetical protein BP5796_12468 [Coleophoma crateriformis]